MFEKLVDWGAAALETASNQPLLPHAIIALNASENDIPQELWDVKSATKAILESMSRTVDQNATFKRYAEFWRRRNRTVENVKQLMLSYYSSVQVRSQKQGNFPSKNSNSTTDRSFASQKKADRH